MSWQVLLKSIRLSARAPCRASNLGHRSASGRRNVGRVGQRERCVGVVHHRGGHARRGFAGPRAVRGKNVVYMPKPESRTCIFHCTNSFEPVCHLPAA